jgi:hypothetical protein
MAASRPSFAAPCVTDGGVGTTACTIPAHARAIEGGAGWKCLRGYTPKGKTCVAIDLPGNATLDISGNTWVCKKGYFELRGVCLPGEDASELSAKAEGPRDSSMAAARRLFDRHIVPGARGLGFAGMLVLAAALPLAAIILFLTQITTWRMPERRAIPANVTLYTPRQRRTAFIGTWRASEDRIDALTSGPIPAGVAALACRHCGANYHRESMAVLRLENKARCVACGKVAMGWAPLDGDAIKALPQPV